MNDTKIPSKLDDEEFFTKIINTFAERIALQSTDTKSFFSMGDADLVEQVRNGNKIPRNDQWLVDLLASIGKESQLTDSEVEDLKNRVFSA